MIIVEGARNVGKTFLIDSLGDGYKKYKFGFGKYYKPYGLSDRKTGMAFAIGKDLQILNLCKAGMIPYDMIMDRGFLSTIVYSVLTERCSLEWAEEYFYRLMEEFKDYIGILYVHGKNLKCRPPKDEWLKIQKYEDTKLFEYFFKKVECYSREYENDFKNTDKTLFKLEIEFFIEDMRIKL